jgi:hypothetical protein
MYPGQFARENAIAIGVFKKLLSAPEGKIFWNSKYKTIGKCFVNGLICHEIDENDIDVFKFPSPLHARYVLSAMLPLIGIMTDVFLGEDGRSGFIRLSRASMRAS